jgi:SAM-dependent methyltransferase
LDWKTVWALYGGCIYDREENGTEDIELMLSLLGEPKNILEPCCGTGRVLAPLARAGHTMTGLDRDCGMLARLPEKIRGLTNAKAYLADVLQCDWGEGYDAVLLPDNTIENLDGARDDVEAQRIVIRKAAHALKPGGHFFLSFNLHDNPEAFFTSSGGETAYAGTDDFGVTGKVTRLGSRYDARTRIASGSNAFELTLRDGTSHTFEESWSKHVLPLELALSWLDEVGMEVEHVWNGYHRQPIAEGQYNNAVIWARKR